VGKVSSQQSRLTSFLLGLLPLLIAGGVAFVLVMIGGKAVQGYQMRQEARGIQQRIDQLKQENRQLSQELDYLHSDAYIEKVAREELGLVRPGDVAVIIVSPDEKRDQLPVPTATPSPTPEPDRVGVPNWQRWLSLFTGQE
jgi:cell division protein FtsL